MANKKLVRNTQDKVFGGVCSGFADYFGWDATWVRVATALSVLVFAGTPILVYLILWAVIPSDAAIYGPGAWQAQDAQWRQAQQTAFDQGYSQGYQQAEGYRQAPSGQPGQPGQPGSGQAQ